MRGVQMRGRPRGGNGNWDRNRGQRVDFQRVDFRRRSKSPIPRRRSPYVPSEERWRPSNQPLHQPLHQSRSRSPRSRSHVPATQAGDKMEERKSPQEKTVTQAEDEKMHNSEAKSGKGEKMGGNTEHPEHPEQVKMETVASAETQETQDIQSRSQSLRSLPPIPSHPLASATPAQVDAWIVGIAPKYESYRGRSIHHNVDGSLLVTLLEDSEAMAKQMLADMDIKNKVHQLVILHRLRDLMNLGR